MAPEETSSTPALTDLRPEPAVPDAAVPPGGNGGDGSRVEGATGPPRQPPARKTRWLVEAAVIVVVALLVAILLRTFVVQTFYIPSESMQPTLQIGDRILVNKLSYHLHAVGRADIVVFARPPLEECGGLPVKDLVKRVVGLPGETISLNAGEVDINGKRLAQPWLAPGITTSAGPGAASYSLSRPYKIPAGHYFLMGDNRGQSCDSRYWGPIPRSLIVGKVEVRVWPLTRISFF